MAVLERNLFKLVGESRKYLNPWLSLKPSQRFEFLQCLFMTPRLFIHLPLLYPQQSPCNISQSFGDGSEAFSRVGEYFSLYRLQLSDSIYYRDVVEPLIQGFPDFAYGCYANRSDADAAWLNATTPPV